MNSAIRKSPAERWEDFRDQWGRPAKLALNEWVFNVTFATVPFWLGVVIFAVGSEVGKSTWTLERAMLSTFSRGELLAFAATFLAPSFWAVSLDPEGAKKFPRRGLWVSLVAIVLLIASATFGIVRSAGYSSQTFSSVIYFTFAVACIALIIRFLILLFHHHRLPVNEMTYNKDMNDFAARFAEHRGQQ